MIDMIASLGQKAQKRLALAMLVALLPLAAACGKAPQPEFQLNMQGRNPYDFELSGNEDEGTKTLKEGFIRGRQDVATALVAMFGTPDDPFVFPESGLDLTKVQVAAGPAFGNQTGKQRGLYRQHCVHCHGITGDGAGTTAAFLNPYPRDYRQGIFKFKSTERAAKPTHADLMRTLTDGIHGTSMPSFMLLPRDEMEALVEYVKYLSIRGECETLMNVTIYNDEEPIELTRDYLVDQVLVPVASAWGEANQQVIQPETPNVPIAPVDISDIDALAKLRASQAEGYKLFHGRGQCAKCHGPTALGDGEITIDDWNDKKLTPQQIAEVQASIASLKADEKQNASTIRSLEGQLATQSTWLLPLQVSKPRDLRMGIYRFGRSPADLYRRIHAGIAGTKMPGGFIAPGNPGNLQPEEIWHLVNYIQSLPYEPMSQPFGREQPTENGRRVAAW